MNTKNSRPLEFECFDPRDPDQRYSDPATWKKTSNSALQTGHMSMMSNFDVDWVQIAEAANYQDRHLRPN